MYNIKAKILFTKIINHKKHFTVFFFDDEFNKTQSPTENRRTFTGKWGYKPVISMESYGNSKEIS